MKVVFVYTNTAPWSCLACRSGCVCIHQAAPLRGHAWLVDQVVFVYTSTAPWSCLACRSGCVCIHQHRSVVMLGLSIRLCLYTPAPLRGHAWLVDQVVFVYTNTAPWSCLACRSGCVCIHQHRSMVMLGLSIRLCLYTPAPLRGHAWLVDQVVFVYTSTAPWSCLACRSGCVCIHQHRSVVMLGLSIRLCLYTPAPLRGHAWLVNQVVFVYTNTAPWSCLACRSGCVCIHQHRSVVMLGLSIRLCLYTPAPLRGHAWLVDQVVFVYTRQHRSMVMLGLSIRLCLYTPAPLRGHAWLVDQVVFVYTSTAPWSCLACLSGCVCVHQAAPLHGHAWLVDQVVFVYTSTAPWSCLACRSGCVCVHQAAPLRGHAWLVYQVVFVYTSTAPWSCLACRSGCVCIYQHRSVVMLGLSIRLCLYTPAPLRGHAWLVYQVVFVYTSTAPWSCLACRSGCVCIHQHRSVVMLGLSIRLCLYTPTPLCGHAWLVDHEVVDGEKYVKLHRQKVYNLDYTRALLRLERTMNLLCH